MKHKPADITLDQAWSKAICYKYKGKCALCGAEGTQAHHIVKRRYKLTRWLVGNGVWLCHKCHDALETNPEFARSVGDLVDDSIALWSKWTLEDWCVKNGMTKNEFRAERLKELKAYVNG